MGTVANALFIYRPKGTQVAVCATNSDREGNRLPILDRASPGDLRRYRRSQRRKAREWLRALAQLDRELDRD